MSLKNIKVISIFILLFPIVLINVGIALADCALCVGGGCDNYAR